MHKFLQVIMTVLALTRVRALNMTLFCLVFKGTNAWASSILFCEIS